MNCTTSPGDRSDRAGAMTPGGSPGTGYAGSLALGKYTLCVQATFWANYRSLAGACLAAFVTGAVLGVALGSTWEGMQGRCENSDCLGLIFLFPVVLVVIPLVSWALLRLFEVPNAAAVAGGATVLGLVAFVVGPTTYVLLEAGAWLYLACLGGLSGALTCLLVNWPSDKGKVITGVAIVVVLIVYGGASKAVTKQWQDSHLNKPLTGERTHYGATPLGART